MADRKIQYSIVFNIDKSSLNQINNDLQQVQKRAANLSPGDQLSNSLREAAKEAKQLESILNSSWNDKLGSVDTYKLNSKIRESYGNINKFREAMQRIGPEGTEAYNQVASAIINTNTQMTKSSKLLNAVATSLGNSIRWGLSSSVVNSFSRSIQGAWGYVQHLDKSLNRIRVVTGESSDNMEKFAKQANEAALRLGASTLDYTDAALIYYQQGLSDEEVASRTETTLKMANVLGVAAQEVSSYMTAIWNNFDDGSKSLEYFGDVITKLGANTASSASEIAEGLSKFASIAETVGLSYEYATASLATVVANTRQSAEVVGTAFKTIFARMEDLKLGETLEDGTDLGKYSQGLAIAGVSIKNSAGELKSMDEILSDMGEKWKTLSEDQQVALAQTVAGVRQYSQLVALMNNWDEVKNNIELASDATGTLTDQQEIYMQSMQSHYQKLNTQWQRTYDIIFNPETMNETVDVVESLLEHFNDFIESIGGGAKAIGYFAAMFTNLFSNQIATSLQRVVNNVKIIQSNRNILRSHKEFSGQQGDKLLDVVNMGNAEAGVVISNQKALNEQVEANKKILSVSRLLTAEQQKQLKNNAREAAYEKQKAQSVKDQVKRLDERYKGRITDKSKAATDNLFQNVEKDSKGVRDAINHTQENINRLNNEIEKEIEEQQNEAREFYKNEGFSDDQIEEKVKEITSNDSIKQHQEELKEQQDILATLEYDQERLKIEANGTADAHERTAEALENTNDSMIKSATHAKRMAGIIQGISVASQLISVTWGAISNYHDEIAEAETKEEKTLAKRNRNVALGQGAASALAMGFGTAFGGPVAGQIAATLTGTLGSIVGDFFTKGAKKAAEEAKKAMEQAAKELEESRKKIEDLTSQKETFSSKDVRQEWQVLVAGVDEYGNNLSLTNEQYSKYLQYCKEMAAIDDSLVDGYNRQGEAIITSVDAMDKMNDALERQVLLTQQQSVSGDQYEARVKEIKDANKEAKSELDILVKQRDKKINNIFSNNYLAEDAVETGDAWKQSLSQVVSNINEGSLYKEIIKKYAGEDNTLDYDEFISNIEEILKEYEILSKEIKNVNTITIDTKYFQEEIKEAKEVIDQYSGSIKEAKEKVKDFSSVQNLAYLKATTDDIEKFQSLTNEQVSILKQYSENIKNTATEEFKKLDVDKQAEEWVEQINNFENVLLTAPKDIQDAFNKINNLDFDTQGQFEEAKKQVQEYISSLEDPDLRARILEVFNIGIGEDATDAIKDIKENIKSIYGEDVKIPNLDVMSINELKSFNEYLIQHYQDLDREVDENTYRFFLFSKAVDDSNSAIETLQNKIDLANTALENFAKGEKLTKKEAEALQESLKALEDQYPKLKDIEDKTSHEYIQMVREVREESEAGQMEALINQNNNLNKAAEEYEKHLKDLYKEYEETNNRISDGRGGLIENPLKEVQQEEIAVKIQADMSEYEKTMQQIQQNQYQIHVQIKADMDTDIENALGLTKEFEQLQNYVKEDLTVSLDDVQKIIDAGYGEMLQSATVNAEGQMVLNKEVMNAFIDGKQAELEADKQSKIEQLKAQKTILLSQIEILESQLANFEKVKGTTDEIEMQSALQAIEDQEIQYDAFNEMLKDELNGTKEEKEQELKILDEYFTMLGGEYKNNSLLQQAAQDDSYKHEVKVHKKRFEMLEQLRKAYNDVLAPTIRKAMAGEQANLKIDVEGQKAHFDKSIKRMISNFNKAIKGEVSKTKTDIDLSIDADGAEKVENKYSELVEKLKDGNKEAQHTIDVIINQKRAELQDLKNRVGAIDGSIAILEAAGVKLDKLQKGAKEKIKDSIELLEVELDRYHDINIALKEIETQLKRLQNEQKKLYGQELTDNLNKQLDILETQRDLTKQKLEMTRQEAREYRNSLSAQGVEFNADGTISNYRDALQSKLNYVNALTIQYNLATENEREELKKSVDAAKKDFDAFQKSIQSYDTLISDTIPGLEDSIQEILDKEIEIKISKFSTTVDIRLNMEQAEKDFNNFKKKVIDQLKDDDILGQMNAGLVDYTSLYDTAGIGTGPIQALTKQVLDIRDQINQIDQTGTSSVYGNNRQKALEDLEKYNKELMNHLISSQDAIDNIKKTYLSMIDQVEKGLKDQVSQYQIENDILKHDLNLIGLLYGDKSYDKMRKYYSYIETNNLKRADMLRKEKEYYEYMMHNSQSEEEREKWASLYQGAVKELNSLIEEALKNIKDKYKNAINEIFDEWEKKLTGGEDLEWLSSSWERAKNLDEDALDAVNKDYEMESFKIKGDEAINNTSSLKAQKAIRDVMNEQLKILKEKDRVTKYDVERANKMLDIEMKRIALEDARASKNKLRLKRDAQGNYSYQYVADEEQVNNAQDELNKAVNDLYNLDKDKLKENNDTILKYKDEYLKKLKEIQLDETLSEEQKQKRIEELTEYYTQLIEAAMQEHADVKKNLDESLTLSAKNSNDEMLQSYINMSDTEKDKFLGEMLPIWDTGIDEMINRVKGEGGLEKMYTEAMAECDKATNKLEEGIQKLANTAGVNFDEIAQGIDRNVIAQRRFEKENDVILNQYKDQINAARGVIEQLARIENKYLDIKDAGVQAAKSTYNFLTTVRDTASNVEQLYDGVSKAVEKYQLLDKLIGMATTGSGSASGNGNNSNSETENRNKVKIELNSNKDSVSDNSKLVLKPKNGSNFYQNIRGEFVPMRKLMGQEEIFPLQSLNSYGRYLLIKDSNGIQGWIDKEDLQHFLNLKGFASGGYTGQWNSKDGKLAVLHEKELVLNKNDTKNILDVVDTVRQYHSAILSITQDQARAKMAMYYSMLNNQATTALPYNLQKSSDSIDQYVHIEANFPNVKSAVDIETALGNLVNIASQRALSTRR